jgi:hypothetical protein
MSVEDDAVFLKIKNLYDVGVSLNLQKSLNERHGNKRAKTNLL